MIYFYVALYFFLLETFFLPFFLDLEPKKKDRLMAFFLLKFLLERLTNKIISKKKPSFFVHHPSLWVVFFSRNKQLVVEIRPYKRSKIFYTFPNMGLYDFAQEEGVGSV